MKQTQILVLGAGVSGLSTGILLLKDGFEVTLWAKDFPPDTTSNKAGAFWFPYLSEPKDKVTKWARATIQYLDESGILADPMGGCVTKTMIDLLDTSASDPWWKDAIDYQSPSQNELPSGYVDGYKFEAPVMDTTLYMDYLIEMYKRLGGGLHKKEVRHIDEAFEKNTIVVNCSGLGSRELFNDKSVYPDRGQTVSIKPNGYNRVIFDDDGPNKVAMVLPRTHDIVLGTTHQANNWNTEIDPHDTADILRRCSNLDPVFKNAEIIGASVGLRPARDEIRLEAENFGGKTVIHNYGHGGSGFTLSWGCAQEVVALVKTYSK